MRISPPLLSLLLPLPALLLAASASAQGAAPTAEEKPTQAYGESHPACVEWTDGCIVCVRGADGDPACSMVGAACLPAAPSCLKGE